jgi:transcriptional regulator with XRE-family HTH domain
VSTGQNPARLPPATAIGSRLRERRLDLGLAVRELARRTAVSSSLISQIERGKSMPSVTTLYAIVSALDLSMDQLFVPGETRPPQRRSSPSAQPWVVKAGERETLRLGAGVRWERLTRDLDHHTEFNLLIYEPGGASSEDGALVRHAGSEYGLVISGRLSVQLGFETYELGPGDAVSFQSWTPHRLATIGDQPARAIWAVVDHAVAAPQATVATAATAHDRSAGQVDTARALLRGS